MRSINSIKKYVGTSLALASLLVFTGCATVATPQPIATAIAATPELSTLSSLINKAGLTSTLNGPGSFTVFAPSNEAFKAVPQKVMDELAADPAKLKDVLTYHVIPAKVMSSEVKNSSVKSVEGANLALSKAGTFVTVEDAVVLTADQVATNGVVHIVDRVLLPPKR
jgi:uncharacterized surface protein with fasciclin (FAS1) repeats